MKFVSTITMFSALILLSVSSLLANGPKEIRAKEFSRSNDLPAPVATSTSAVKWEEVFDGTTLPAGWQIIDNDGSGAAFSYAQSVAFTSGDTIFPDTAQSFLFSSFNNANGAGLIDEWVISPRLPMIAAGDSLVFYAGAIDDQFKDSLKVYVSTTDSLPGSFTEIAYFKVDGPFGAWNRYAFDMTAYAGSEVFVAVNYYIVAGGPTGNHSDNLWVDHFALVEGSTAVVEPVSGVADGYGLEQNYPNPFNPTTTISYSVPSNETVTLKVYDLTGRELVTLVNGQRHAAGKYRVTFDAARYASGVYFYAIQAGEYQSVRRMVLMK